jgi:D-xylose transport system substrate-binding protein
VIRSISIVLALGLAVSACKKTEGPDVAFLLSTLQEERYQKDVKYFEARAKELGIRVITLAADNDNAKQIAQVEDVLNQGAKVLVIQPTDSMAASAYVRLAHEKGAKVIAYDRAIVAKDLDYYVSTTRIAGVLQAEAALAATGGKGKYVLLSGQSGHSVATEITRGYEHTLAPYIARGDVEIVMQQSHSSWSPEQALRTVEDALTRTGGKVDAILANNSGMARGAVQAVTTAGLTKVFIAGADADAANINFVCQGKQTIEVLKDIQPLAQTAAEVAKNLVDGQAPKRGSATVALGGGEVPVAAVRVEVVTPDNVKSLLVDSGFLQAGQLPACANKLGEQVGPPSLARHLALAQLHASSPTTRCDAVDRSRRGESPWDEKKTPPSTAHDEGHGHERRGKPTSSVRASSSARRRAHGYARMPLSAQTTPREPYLVDNDYYLSGFSYTRLYEPDWTELFFSAQTGNYKAEFGIFASLYSDYATPRLENQLGIAQASVTAKKFLDHDPLSVQLGVFWDRFGYVEPYDTYIFGRTHQGGLKVMYDLPGGGRAQAGLGMHQAQLQQNLGLTPIAHVAASYPIGDVSVGAYVLRTWTRDTRQLSPIQDGTMYVAGLDGRYTLPNEMGSVYAGFSYMDMTKVLYLAPALEVMHSTGGRGLTENFLGLDASEDGTGKMYNPRLDAPIQITDRSARAFGMLTWVRRRRSTRWTFDHQGSPPLPEVGSSRAAAGCTRRCVVDAVRPRDHGRLRPGEQLPRPVPARHVPAGQVGRAVLHVFALLVRRQDHPPPGPGPARDRARSRRLQATSASRLVT